MFSYLYLLSMRIYSNWGGQKNFCINGQLAESGCTPMGFRVRDDNKELIESLLDEYKTSEDSIFHAHYLQS